MKTRIPLLLTLFTLLVSFLAGCAGGFVPPDPIGRAIFGGVRNITRDFIYEPTESIVYRPRPALRREVRPRRPLDYRDPVWIDGRWAWSGRDWIWRPGQWVDRPRSGYRWVEPQYVRHGNAWRWRSGYWGRY